MVSFFSIMITISTIIAMVTSTIFFVGILFKSQYVSDIETFSICNNQVKVCRISSIIFAFLYWFVVSGLSQKECLEGYAKLSGASSRLGSIWIIFAFINIILSVIFSILKRGKDEMEIMGKLRKSSFFMGAVFFVIAFILKVN